MRRPAFVISGLLLTAAAACGLGGSAPAATYVVDQAAPGAADTNTGTEQSPFKTIQPAADLARPGDSILVMAGRYDERVRFGASGAEGRPITLEARPRHSARVSGFVVDADYIRLDGFEIAAAKPAVAVQLNASHCEVLDNSIHDMMVGVAGTVGKPGPDGTRDYSAVSHNRVAYNKVYHSEYGFMLGGNDWLVENNEVDRLFMYAPGNRYDDCDYSRFFGRGCVERANYFHGSTASEIRVAHVDCLQTFTVNGEIAQDLVFENNTCFDFHQMCMVEGAPHIGSVRDWTFRGNIVSADSPTMSGGWGPDIIQTPDVSIRNNTISTVRWATIGLRGLESTNGRICGNILCHAERAIIDGDQDFTASKPAIEHNLTFATSAIAGAGNLNGQDPLFVNGPARNFRLQAGSPAIGAGKDGATIGALEYPNIYYVDPRHPAATDDPGWGYPAVPLASLAKACAEVKPGDSIVLREGIYRETLRLGCDRVTIRADKGAKVILSGADRIENWTRQADGTWSATVPSTPRKVLRDGLAFSAFTYNPHTKALVVNTGDPRLHVYETIVRDHAIDLAGRKEVQIQNISVADTLKTPGVVTNRTGF